MFELDPLTIFWLTVFIGVAVIVLEFFTRPRL